MLAPEHRVVLLDHLRAPEGYRMDAAVGTTFSLSFITSLVAPLAFGAHEIRSGTDPIAVLEAVRSTTDRLDIFYQGGRALIPSSVPDLVAMLEPMIHPVRRPRPGRLFHPKVWCLRYTSPNQPAQYRLLVSSRNLTDSTAWDVIVRLDGEQSPEPRTRNAGLAALLRQLPEWSLQPIAAERRQRIEGLAAEVERVAWTLHGGDGVEEFDLFALGVPGAEATPDFSGASHLVVAPFLTAEGLDLITAGSSRIHVVSETRALDGLDDEARHRLREQEATFVMAPDSVIPRDEDDSDGAASPGEHSGLHAKIVVVDRHHGYGRWRSHVFAGSANATTAAFDGNVEFLVELVGRCDRLGVDRFIGEDAPFRNLVQPYELSEQKLEAPDDEAQRRLQDLLQAWAEAQLQIAIEQRDGSWSLHLTSATAIDPPDGHRLEVELLSHPGPRRTHHGGRLDEEVHEVPLVDITPFVVFRVTDCQGISAGAVMQAALINDRPQERLDAVLARQIDSPEKFLRYVLLLLGFVGDEGLMGTEGLTGASRRWADALSSGDGLLELLLGAVATRQETLHEIDHLVQRLQATEDGLRVMPEGFMDLWQVVRDAAKATAGSR